MDETGQNNFKIVLLSKNEDRNIPIVVSQLLKEYKTENIIAVLDGNIKPTADFLLSKNVKFIQGPNMGKGAAIRAAIRMVNSNVLVFMDADGSHNLREIDSLIRPLMDNRAEMVIASRFLGRSEELHGSLENIIRRLGNISGNWIINFLWNRGKKAISDCQNGFRSIKRKVALDLGLQENSFSIEEEMVIRCLKLGHRIIEVPSVELQRNYGESHIKKIIIFHYIGCIIKNLFKK